MALTEEQVTAQNFKDFYNLIKPYLNYQPTMGFTPVGTIISVMGTHAPAHYLICDGTEYYINDHLELAGYFKEQFGSVNHFGGDGTSTFAVPDLRGEFLRGTGTNVHENQGSGANVGEHQDGTEHRGTLLTDAAWLSINQSLVENQDTVLPYTAVGRYYYSGASDSYAPDSMKNYTTRPTNTSVLYCIAEKNIFIQNYEASNIYSEDEKIIGNWIDGKPLYQKTWTGLTSPQSGQTSNLIEVSSFIDTLVNISGNLFEGIPINAYSTDTYNVFTRREGNYIKMGINGWSNAPVTLTLQYTKITD